MTCLDHSAAMYVVIALTLINTIGWVVILIAARRYMLAADDLAAQEKHGEPARSPDADLARDFSFAEATRRRSPHFADRI